jgi:hypothetical protein
MKIRDLRRDDAAGRPRVTARVEWEDRDRPALDLFFETTPEAAEGFAASPDALVAACFLPAARHGERRIAIDGAVCPRMHEGLRTMGRLLESWFGRPHLFPAVEPSEGFRAPRPRRPRRSAFFFTGGVDSTHLLLSNRRDFPPDHPDRFRDALAVFGLYAPDQLAAGDVFGAYRRTAEILGELAAEGGVGLVPVATNVTALEPEIEFIAQESLSSALAACAHLFSSRWSDISLASGRDVSILVPLGTHPLLDPYLSSAAVELRHVGIAFTRPERLREVCAWDAAVQRLVVCMAGPPPPLVNCGVCEKCMRTMTALAGLGRLADAREFPVRELSPDAIDAFPFGPHYAPYWRALLPLLRDGKRDDLAAAVERQLEDASRAGEWFQDAGWKGKFRRADRRWFGGRMMALRRALRRSP